MYEKLLIKKWKKPPKMTKPALVLIKERNLFFNLSVKKIEKKISYKWRLYIWEREMVSEVPKQVSPGKFQDRFQSFKRTHGLFDDSPYRRNQIFFFSHIFCFADDQSPLTIILNRCFTVLKLKCHSQRCEWQMIFAKSNEIFQGFQ